MKFIETRSFLKAVVVIIIAVAIIIPVSVTFMNRYAGPLSGGSLGLISSAGATTPERDDERVIYQSTDQDDALPP